MPPSGRSTTDHDNKSADGEHTVCAERRAGTASSGQSSSENRQDVWDTDLCVGKRQGGGEETVSFVIRHYCVLTNRSH